MTRERTYDAAGFVDQWVLATDLAGPTQPRLLTGQLSDPRVPTDLADAADAVAATNGDFFAINTTNAPIGPVVRDGELLKADAAGADAVGLGATGLGQVANLLLEGTLTVGGTTRPLAGLNSNALPRDAVSVYTPDWGTGDRGYVATTGPVVEVEVREGRVAEVRAEKTGKAVPDGGYVLLADGTVATALLATPVGTPVTVDYHARTDAPRPWSLALGAHEVLVRDGAVVVDGSTDTQLKPRTALGWTTDHRLLMAVFDGSSSRSRGLTGLELATRMKGLGAVDAVMLDGGGSTQLVTRDQRAQRRRAAAGA
jgi:hypothetical protein